MILYKLNILSVTINKKQQSTLRRLSWVLLKVRCWHFGDLVIGNLAAQFLLADFTELTSAD
jgi:hypothetical protein